MFLLNVKAMIVVLVTALIMFALLKPMFLRFIDPEDFRRRRILWFVHATAAFLAPSFWIYLLVALPTLIWATRRDSNPIGIWLFIVFAIPPVNVAIPLPLVQTFTSISQERMLGMFLLLPMMLVYLHGPRVERSSTQKTMDFLLISYIAYQLILAFPYDSLTGQLRRAFNLFLDNFVVYFVFSRYITDKRRLIDVMAGLCLPAIVMAPLAMFESTRNWLLYTMIGEVWGQVNEFAWLFRGDSLRSQLTMGHSIAMGYVMATALAFWLFLKSDVKGMRLSWAVSLLLCGAIIVSYSRGAWIQAAMLPVLLAVLAPGESTARLKSLIVVAAVAFGVYLTPFGARIADLLPFIGKSSQDTVDYRQQIQDLSWVLVQQHPFFGNPFASSQMESLRQGQGLIDMVNIFASVAIFQGLVGLFMFAGFFVAPIIGAYRWMRQVRHDDPVLAAAGAALVACMITTVLIMYTTPGVWFMWVMAGILAAYTAIPVTNVVPVSVATREPRSFSNRYARG